jgi:SAM-dependent methyltransferase
MEIPAAASQPLGREHGKARAGGGEPVWSDGYPLGPVYPALFHRELTPLWLATVTTALGHRPPALDRPYTWCELGCASGLSALIAATANPGGDFYAVDFDPAALSHARALGEEAGIANIHFLSASFAELAQAADTTLPPLDFIVSHGVLSWISPENRQAVWRIVARWLKPGGIACLAYMSQPGAVPLMAAQRLLRRIVETTPATAAALEAGIALLRALRDGGAGQFIEMPQLGAQLEKAAQEPLGYLAHEFLGAHWTPLHVADVMAALEWTGARFLGSATPLENIDAVSIPARAQPVIAALADPALRETAKDIARNQNLRRDLYQRDARPFTVAEHRAALEALRFIALPGAPKAGALRFDTRIGPIDGPAQMFSPILAALASGEPWTFRDLMALPAYGGSGQDGRGGLVNQASQMLLWAGILHPCPPQIPDAAPAQALNRALARAAGLPTPWRAAPEIGSGVQMTGDG